jgi:ABC-type nitrate/sulfonate/bicarbonate transport system substrate-binding protein
MTISRRSFLAATAAIAASAPLASLIPAARAQSATKVKFTLPWIPHGGYTSVFVAKKLGAWEKRGVDVTIDRGFGSGEVCKTLGLGQYDFGNLDIGVMTNCVSKGLDLVAIGLLAARSPIGIFSLAKKGIKTPKDLEGKKVAFATGSGDYQLWPAFVKATGIDDARVQKVLMGPEALIKSLIDEQVDAEGNFYGSIAPSVWAQGLDMNLMLYEDYGVKMYSLSYAAPSKTVKEKADLCAKFVEGAMEGLKYTYLHPNESIDIHLEMVKEFKGSPTNRDVVKHGQGVMTAMGLVPEVEKNGLGWMDPEIVKRTRETVVAYMGAKDVPPAERLFTNAFAGKVKLTPAEWAAVKASVARYIPVKS